MKLSELVIAVALVYSLVVAAVGTYLSLPPIIVVSTALLTAPLSFIILSEATSSDDGGHTGLVSVFAFLAVAVLSALLLGIELDLSPGLVVLDLLFAYFTTFVVPPLLVKLSDSEKKEAKR